MGRRPQVWACSSVGCRLWKDQKGYSNLFLRGKSKSMIPNEHGPFIMSRLNPSHSTKICLRDWAYGENPHEGVWLVYESWIAEELRSQQSVNYWKRATCNMGSDKGHLCMKYHISTIGTIMPRVWLKIMWVGNLHWYRMLIRMLSNHLICRNCLLPQEGQVKRRDPCHIVELTCHVGMMCQGTRQQDYVYQNITRDWWHMEGHKCPLVVESGW